MKLKRNSIIIAAYIIVGFSCFFIIGGNFFLNNNISSREKYEKFLNERSESKLNEESENEGESETDRPDLAFEQEFIKTMDPSLGYPPAQRLYTVYNKINQIKRSKSGIPGDALNNWIERGPNNVGGRVRAIMFDPNDATNKKVWAGSVSGGLWYNNDITDVNSTWKSVDDFWANIAISAIAYDPTNTQLFYVGTGEGWFNSDGVIGAGIWKSVDGGLTWSQLPSTVSTDFKTIQKIVVTTSGRVIVGTNKGIFISDNGGVSWTSKSEGFVSDIEIAGNGAIFVGKGRSGISGSILKSIDLGDNWLDITPTDSVQERVELAVAPSNSSIIYAVSSAKSSNISWFKKSSDGGATWINVTVPRYLNQTCVESSTDDFARGQAWYDLILAVFPTQQDIIIAGGIDLNKSVDGGLLWKTISYWTGACYSYVHADQHSIVFRPGHNNEVVVGNDGGISYSSNIDASTPVFSDRNKGLNITQYYTCAIHPDPLKNYFLAGCQDNGSHKFTNSGINSVSYVSGGDGAFCFIDQKNPEIQISSYVYNNFYISRDGGNTFSTLQNSDDGSFINPSDYDNNLHILYSAKSTTSLNRVSNIKAQPTIEALSITNLGSMASHIKVSKYTTNTTTLFVGTRAGRLFKVTGAEGSSSTATEITGATFPIGYISGIDLGASENEIIVTFSNYGVNSVWYTNDGGVSWTSKEGNLPDMPVRWVLFNPNNRNQAILATEVGVWSTSNLNDLAPVWTPSISGLANVRVDMFRLRESDFEVVAATHGRGLFTSSAFSNINKNELAAYFSTSGSSNLKFGGTVQFEDLSTGLPTSYNWTFEGGSPATSTEKNPTILYTKSGSYDVTLSVSNGTETKTLTKTDYIVVGGSDKWTEQATGFPDPARGIDYIDMVDKSVVWATAFDGTDATNRIKEFTKTVNGGNTWTSGKIDIPGTIYPSMICALNKDTAWVPMYPDPAGSGGGIYITTNGGTSWTKQASALFTGTDAFANVVYFWNKNDGFCMGDPNDGYFEIYTTNNGGNTWTRVPKTNIPSRSATDEYGTVGQFCVTDNGVVFFNTTKGRIYKSKDKGLTWSVIVTPLKARNKIAFADENNGVIIENADNISTFRVYYTKNAGTTWTQTVNANVYPDYIEYVSGTGRMYISSSANGSKSGSSYSTDGGITWTRFADVENTQCLALDFYDLSLGWIGQFNSTSAKGGILKYTGITAYPDFTIGPANPVIENPVVFTDNSLCVDAVKSYQWDFGLNATPATANTPGPHNVTYSAKGNKTVTLTLNGQTIKKDFNISITDVADLKNEEAIKVYPNPSDGIFSLKMEFNKSTDLYVGIFNMKGQLIYLKNLKPNTNLFEHPVDLTKSGKGTYILKIKGKDINETRKIVVE